MSRPCSLAVALLGVLGQGGCSDYGFSPSDNADPGDEPGTCTVDYADAYAVNVDEDCGFEADAGGFDPQVEWRWDSNAGAPGFDDVMMTPVVGDVDADGLPEVVFTAYANDSYSSAGALVILLGDGPEEELSVTDIGGYNPVASAGVALGDLDGDGVPEIVTLATSGHVICLHADGSLVWASSGNSGDYSTYGYPVIADLDADGLAEVVVGRAIFDAAGVHVGSGSYGTGGSYSIPVVADLDMDGQQEVVVGNAAYTKAGEALWYNGLSDGWTAVADFDGDGFGEVTSVVSGYVYLLDTDGSVLWGPVPVPGGGGGPPTVADFDGDGSPEVGVAGLSGYVVYDTDGTELWVVDTTDASSARTGSSVFDFEGDGQWEVVYADELVLWVYDGATGAPLMADDRHSSWTLFEYPIVVDVDADGASELVLMSNDSINSGWQGITVIGDAAESWAPTTTTWNQHAYHITNVEDDLSVPAEPEMNWNTGHNSFRAGGPRDRPGYPAADLKVAILDACWSCEAAVPVDHDPAWVELAVAIENVGTEDVVGNVRVSAYLSEANGDTTLLGTEVVSGLAAGEGSAAFTMSFEDLPALSGVEDIFVRVDDPGMEHGAVTNGVFGECTETNNQATAAPECD